MAPILSRAYQAAMYFAGSYIVFYLLHRPESNARRRCLLAVMAVFWALFFLVILRLPFINDANSGLLLFLGPVMFALICGDPRRSLFSAAYWHVISTLINNLGGFLFIGIAGYWPAENSATRLLLFDGLIHPLLLGWSYFYYRIMRGLPGRPPLPLWFLTVAPAIAAYAVTERFIGTGFALLDKGENIFFDVSLAMTLVLGLLVFIFFMYIRLMSTYEARLENQSLQSQLAAQTRQNRLIEGAQKQAGEIRHEMKNLLFALQIELEHENYAGAKTRIAALLGEMKQYELKPYTMIPVIDAMIAYKGEKLREAGAAFSASADPLNVSDECAYDLASLLAIALDNATEAVALLPEKGAAVRLDIRRLKNLALVQLSNPFVKPLKYRDGELQTTKEEPGHGLGLPALRRIVERYSGEVSISDNNGTFLLKAMLMVG